MKSILVVMATIASVASLPTSSFAAAKDCKSGYEWNNSTKKCERVSSY